MFSSRGSDHVLFDPVKPGDSWRSRWDSFTLVTPNWTLRLPGHHYPGADPDGFLKRDDLARYVADFAETVRPTIIPARVTSLTRGARWDLSTDHGHWTADAVIIPQGTTSFDQAEGGDGPPHFTLGMVKEFTVEGS